MALGRVIRRSRSRQGSERITPHFQVIEFACRDGSDLVLLSPDTLGALEKIRAYYRRFWPTATISINSGYRTPSYNRRIGGARGSQHIYGRAADFIVKIPGGKIPARKVFNDINAGRILGTHQGGLGSYATFVHIDTGPTRRWRG
jgi:uncharacterized protein YcbK (DUF882 family)